VHYSPGALLLSEAAAGDGRAAKLLLAARNLALPATASVNTGLTSGVPGLREMVTELEQHIPGACVCCWLAGWLAGWLAALSLCFFGGVWC